MGEFGRSNDRIPFARARAGRLLFAIIVGGFAALPSALAGPQENDERAYLHADGSAAIIRFENDPVRSDEATREPVILVHGIGSDPWALSAIANRLANDRRFGVYFLAYDDFHRRTSLNGVDLARELCRLADRRGGYIPRVTVIAHSLGGIVARRALNELVLGSAQGLAKFGAIRAIAIDTPWHGFIGPADTGPFGEFFRFAVAPLMPDGLEDMRAQSKLFVGDPDSASLPERLPLNLVVLPPNVSLHLVFAQEGTDAHDYTESPLDELPQRIVDHVLHGAAVDDSQMMVNFWQALTTAEQFGRFWSSIGGLKAAGTLTDDRVLSALLRDYPRYPGNHVGITLEQPGRASFLDALPGML